MSSERDQIRSIAERIARRLSEGEAAQAETRGQTSGGDDGELATLRARLSELQQRLAHLESHISHDESCDVTAQNHPATDRREGASTAAAQQRQSGQQSPQMPVGSTWLSGTYVPVMQAHPSEERFGISEAVSELVDFFEREKICSVEPGGKPCDHCGMCSSRGF